MTVLIGRHLEHASRSPCSSRSGKTYRVSVAT